MLIFCDCETPLGRMRLAADDRGLTGAWFYGQKYFARGLSHDGREGTTPVLEQAKQWLADYFAGSRPEILLPLHLIGTEFQKRVWQELARIPYGGTTTYAAIAAALAGQGHPTSARAVGGAVGRNPISVILPCHRVLGSDGSLTGYAGGIGRKQALLALERGESFWHGQSVSEHPAQNAEYVCDFR